MNKIKNSVVAIAALVLAVGIQKSFADDATRGRMKESTERQPLNDPLSSVSKAATVYRALIKEGRVPSSILTKANCVAVFPSVVTAAVAVGGTHGDGVAFCKNSTGAWGNPVFLDLNGASIGAQLGVKSTDIVLYMTGDKAKNALASGNFTLSGELSAVAGSFDKTFAVPNSGVVAFSNTGGAFLGASIDGVHLSHDKDEQKAFYGTYDPNSMFEGRIPPSVEKSVTELKALLPA